MNAKKRLSAPHQRKSISGFRRPKLQFVAQNCSSSHSGCSASGSSLSFAPLFTSIQQKPTMKTSFQTSLQLAAVAVSVSVNVLLAFALDASLSRQPAQSVSQVQLPSVTVVAKRSALTSPQLAAASTSKSF